MSLARRAAKRDINDPEHVAEWRLLGALPLPVSQSGYMDHIVLYDGHTFLAETKGRKKGLTEAQVETFGQMYAMGVHVYIVRSRGDARAMLEGRLAPWTPSQGRGAGAEVRKREHRPGHSRFRNTWEGCAVAFCPTSHLNNSRFCAKHEGTT